MILETDRLIVRPLNETDLNDMFALDSNPKVHQYLGNKPITHKQEALNYIKSTIKQYNTTGVGRWAVIEKETKSFIGWCGLRLYNDMTFNNKTNFYDIGYRLLPKYWGKGYATESAKACLNYAFSTLNLNTIYGITEKENAASHAVLLKIGLNYIEDFYHDAEQMTLRWYALNKTEYQNIS